MPRTLSSGMPPTADPRMPAVRRIPPRPRVAGLLDERVESSPRRGLVGRTGEDLLLHGVLARRTLAGNGQTGGLRVDHTQSMGSAVPGPLSGRAHERAALVEVMHSALGGRPQALLLHGEAGVGKTALARSVVEELRIDGVQVLWGQGLRFGAVEAMYYPLVLALEGWLPDLDRVEKAALVEAIPSAALILPSLGAPPVDGQAGLLTVVDGLVSRAVARAPTVLVVDDVHWADPATWDALSYLVAGFARQPMALLTTHRDEVVGDADFQRWLAHLRRLPGTQEMLLERLDLPGTVDQIGELLGHPPSPGFAQQVHVKSRGNPYLSELLVRSGDLEAEELPADLPDELSQALLDAWRGLTSAGREITRVLAVAGRPTDAAVLSAVAADLDVPEVRSLREAVDAGVVVMMREGAWFRHPLLAEVLAGSYLPGEAAPVHAAWAQHLEKTSATGVEELRRLGDLATHHELAGVSEAAFAMLLRAADLAEELGAFREHADLLTRAADLWEAGASQPEDDRARARLLERAGVACGMMERYGDCYRLYELAHRLVDPDRDPLWSSRLAREVTTLAQDVDRDTDVVGGLAAAVELSRVDPDSREHADALSDYAYWGLYGVDRDHALRVADEAVAVAHRSGSAAALALSYGTRGIMHAETDPEQAERDVDTSWDHAIRSGDNAVIARELPGRFFIRFWRGDLRGAHQHALQAMEWSQRLGGVGERFSGFLLSSVLLELGDLNAAGEVLRRGLAAGDNKSQSGIRVNAAVLAVRRGVNDAARNHLARARELNPLLEQVPILEGPPRLAELSSAWGDPAEAFAVLERSLPFRELDPAGMDSLLVAAARVTADLVERARDDRDEDSVRSHLLALDRLVSARGEQLGTPFALYGDRDSLQPARAALYAAERSRAEGATNQVERWREALAACATAGLGWQLQYASWRLAAALLAAGQTGAEVGELLRSVHGYTIEQGAAPLQQRVEDLAGLARVSLREPRLPASAPTPVAFAGLTPREAEVLSHLVADRTYAEIASALFISEKTVSVHVSNLLRKTGCGSRREVAALARRVGWDGTAAAVR